MNKTSNIKHQTLGQPKLSIVVPIYNVEQYLRKCVESLLMQDYNDYEIILVDDGSTDKSSRICDDFASPSFVKSLTRSIVIKVIHQENRGLSAARNTGIKAAKGEYICFVDSDDYWEPNVLGGLMAQIERDNLDVLRFDYQNVRLVDSQESRAESRYETFEPFRAAKRDVDYSDTVTDGETFLNERLGPACYAVMFVIKRNLIISDQKSAFSNQLKEKDNCLFTEGIYFEDTEWTPRMLLRAKRVASTPVIVYNYLWRTGSITLPTNPVKRKKVLDDKIKLLYGFQEQSRFVKDSKWFTWMTSFNTMTILGMLASLSAVERKPYLHELKSLNIFPLSTAKEKILSHRVKIILANISPSLYCNLMSLRK